MLENHFVLLFKNMHVMQLLNRYRERILAIRIGFVVRVRSPICCLLATGSSLDSISFQV